MNLAVVIPVRLNSKRFPNKAFAQFLGKPIIDNVIDYCSEFNFESHVWVATDSREIFSHTLTNHKYQKVSMIHSANCGTNRVFKFYQRHPKYNWYMSIPCDEPAIDPIEINEIFEDESEDAFDSNVIHSFYTKFYCQQDLETHLSCKVVTDKHNYMLYNSRNIIPLAKNGKYLPLEEYKKHVGIFLFPKKIFEEYGSKLWDGINIESLEQNMFMQTSVKVKMHELHHIGFGIDVPDQIPHLERRLKFGFDT